jgi:hypothetical protein
MTSPILILDSRNEGYRAVVTQLSDLVFRVEVERLIESLDAGGVKRGEFWSVLSGSNSLTDSLESARNLAHEKLNLL